MKYSISFQEMGKKHGRPIDNPSASDFEITEDRFGLIPNVGDYVQIEPIRQGDAPRFSGRVTTRLFRYFGNDICGVNIVVTDSPEDDWGAVIKE